MPVSVCYCPRIAEKRSKIKMLGKFQKNTKKYPRRKTLEDRRGSSEGGHPLSRRLHNAARGGGRTLWPLGPQGPPLRLPFGIYLALITETLEEPPVTRFRPLFLCRS